MHGTQLIIDGEIRRAYWPTSVEMLEKILVDAAEAGGATVIGSRVVTLPHAVSKTTSPPGGTAWVGLDESHVTLHWYDIEGTPNIHGTIKFALDVFTCGDYARPLDIADGILVRLGELVWYRSRTVKRFESAPGSP